MLWQYTELLFIVAGLATILSFHKSIDRLGQVFFLLVGAASWVGFGIGLLKVNFKWGGSTTVVNYTYIPSTESPFIFLFLGMGLLMLIIGGIRAIELAYAPLMKFDAGHYGRGEEVPEWEES